MAHLIDKDALVAEIEKLMYGANLEADIASTGDCFDENIAKAKYQLCKYILGVINALEVKEVDLEKECSQYFEDWTVQADLGLTKPDGWSCIVKDLYDIAKHFFTLGLKAKQG